MKTIPIHITKEEYEWLSQQAAQEKVSVAQMIEAMVRDAFLYPGEQLPPYDWGDAGIPEGEAIEYDPDIGFVMIGDEEK